MNKKDLWSVGITLKFGYAGGGLYGWWAWVDFENSAEPVTDGCMSGRVSTKYGIDICKAIDQVLELCSQIGVEFIEHADCLPAVYYLQDGDSKDYPPPEGWREILKAQADRIGWNTYK